MMTFDDFVRKILEICPNAYLDEDRDGQIIVNTGFCENSEGEIVPCEDEEEG